MDEKLQKVLAREGLGSRRAMEQVIQAGKVLVNGRTAQLGDRVTDSDKIVCDGRVIQNGPRKKSQLRVLLYNKPEGEICSRSDPEGRKTVYDSLPRLRQGRWIGVGRLDINTSGAMLFTNDGDFANKLMHPSSVIDREYLVRTFGEVTDEMLRHLREGVLLEDGIARFSDIGSRDTDQTGRWYYCTLMEGRNREVRRLWESQGVKVSRLKRVRYANIFLPSYLKVGQWVELNNAEITDLALTAGFAAPTNLEPLNVEQKQALEKQRSKLRRPGTARKPSAIRKSSSSRKPSSSDKTFSSSKSSSRQSPATARTSIAKKSRDKKNKD